MKKYEIIDYFKGLSFLGILFYHLISLYTESAPSILKTAANAGSSGVLVFFFCSGFVLTASQSRRQRSWCAFMKRRLLSVYLPYITVVLVCFLIPLIHAQGTRWVALMSHIFQFRAFSLTYFNALGSHFWYISTILELYILYIPLYRLMKKIGVLKFGLACLAVNLGYIAALWLAHADDNNILIRLFPKYLFVFALGMMAQALYEDGKISLNTFRYPLLIVGAIAGIGLYGISSFSSVGRLINDLPECLGVLCLFTLLYRLDLLRTNRLFITMSNVSYEAYLLHMPIMEILFHYADGSRTRDALLSVGAVALTALLAVLYHAVLSRLLGRLLKKPSRPSA